MITKLNRGRNARRVIKKPVLWNRRSRGCCMETSTLEDVISCRAPKCVADAKIYTMQLLLGQYWFTELHTTSYYTKWRLRLNTKLAFKLPQPTMTWTFSSSVSLIKKRKHDNRPKKNKQKMDSGTQKTWYAKCNKTITALHFV
jgi:hypothetical protein